MYNVSDEYKALIKKPIRYTGIKGAIRLKSGEFIDFDDDNVVGGSLKIVRRLNGRGDLRPGGVYSGELSLSLSGFDGLTGDLDGSMIRLIFLLYQDSTMDIATAQKVPLGQFYTDGSTIKRKGGVVSLSAVDGMMLFEVEVAERSGTMFELAAGACSAAGVEFGMAQEEFESLPNAAVSAAVSTASRIQTERDLLMYIGMATASFARMTRDNKLEFVPLTCERDERRMIIPVREISGDLRYKTEFSDETARIGKLFTRQNGKVIASSLSAADGGEGKAFSLELSENPLLSKLSGSEVVTVLNNELLQLYECLNRVYDTEFNGDPALDVGDYVRLRGGTIDTVRGYGTGMITSQVWRYRGRHTLKCNMPASVPVEESSGISTLSLDSPAADRSTIRIQTKSQTEKQLDELRNRSGNIGKLTDVQGSAAKAYLAAQQGVFTGIYVDDPSGSRAFEMVAVDGGTFQIVGHGGRSRIVFGANDFEIYQGGSSAIYVGDTQVWLIAGNGLKFLLQTGGLGVSTLTLTPPSGYGNKLEVTLTDYSNLSGGPSIKFGGKSIEFRSDGLYYDGRRLAFADELQ